MLQPRIASGAAAMLLAGILLAFAATDASARGGWFRGYYGGGSYSRSWYGPRGSYMANIYRAPGQAYGTRSFQTYGGRGVTHSFNRSCGGGTCQRSGSTMTNSGRTWSHSRSVSVTGNSLSWSRNRSTANGANSSRQGSCTVGAGCNSTANLTGPNGNTLSRQGSIVPNGQGGFDYNATIAGPNRSVTRSLTIP